MSLYNRTYETNPELWDDGLSYLAKFEYEDGSQNVLACGWHLRQIEFENRTVAFERRPGEETGFLPVCGSMVSREKAFEGIRRFEVEISLDAIHDDSAVELLSAFLNRELSKDIIESVSTMNRRVSANRSDEALLDEFGDEVGAVDLLCLNMPARSGKTEEPLRALSRWCRVFSLKAGTVTVYRPLDDDGRANLRWPHNCIWLNRGADYYLSKTEIGSVEEAFEIPIRYNDYNLSNWRMEFELWENQPLQIMIDDDSNNASRRFSRVQQDLGVLSKFVTTAFLAVRNLDRRAANNKLIQSDARLGEIAQEHLKKQRQEIRDYRKLLREASGLLANTAQSIQAVANRESAEAVKRTNAFLAYASAVFFVPTLIISFFSMTITSFEDGESVPFLLFVLALCLASVGLAILLILVARLVFRRSHGRKVNSVRSRAHLE